MEVWLQQVLLWTPLIKLMNGNPSIQFEMLEMLVIFPPFYCDLISSHNIFICYFLVNPSEILKFQISPPQLLFPLLTIHFPPPPSWPWSPLPPLPVFLHLDIDGGKRFERMSIGRDGVI